MSLTAWIFLGMAAGIGLGVVAPGVAVHLGIVSDIFLRLIKSIIAPLLFGTLVHGIAGSGSIKQMGRIGLKAIVYFELVTTIALFLGLGAVNLVRPGEGMKLERSASEAALPAAPPKIETIFQHIFPTSVIDAMARGDVLQVVVFSFLFGAACAAIGAKAKPVVDFAQSLAEVMFRYTRYVMYLAPLGVGAAIAVTIGGKGLRVLFGLGKLIAAMYAAQVIFVVVVLGAVIVLTRIPLRGFYDAVKEPFLIAFSTASSEAALPVALENMEQFGVPQHIVAFVLLHRLQLQSRRDDVVSVARFRIHRAGGRRTAYVRPAAHHDADADADEQRRRRCPPRGAGDSGGDARELSVADRRRRRSARDRRRNGYGANVGERAGQLPGVGRGRAVGGCELYAFFGPSANTK